MTTYTIKPQFTAIFLIKENISLIKKLIDDSKKESKPFDPKNTTSFYKTRGKHLQTMGLFGITGEFLIKQIISKRGFSIQEVDHVKKENNKSHVKFSGRTISLIKAIKLFKISNPKNYFKGVKVYKFNQHKINYEYSYLGYKKIDPETCINLIQKIRNNYLHKADSNSEWQGIIWYVYNFILWLAKKEFKNHFSDYKYIGNQEIKNLFSNDL